MSNARPAAAPNRHLDLGCGARPRNPYRRTELHGIDVAPGAAAAGTEIRRGNVALERLPYPDDHFDSVSAFDFLEHVPRLLPAPDGRSTRFPFVELMNEVWRVLAPGGRFYALTPCYPAVEAFQDPTHVNVITDRTHHYFCGEAPLGRIYGFEGRFDALRIEWVVFGDAQFADVRPTLHQRIRRLNYRLKGRLSHLCWEWRAVKPGPADR